EEVERKAREEVERKAREEVERKAQEEVERKAQEEARRQLSELAAQAANSGRRPWMEDERFSSNSGVSFADRYLERTGRKYKDYRLGDSTSGRSEKQGD
ncbi:hypothetical protein, partial [Burkholderia ubonensis]|uniref:hypothetical protein n=1 Tax=Burkholderia ubonensis TaxID=101571 RepID=UPI0039F632E5